MTYVKTWDDIMQKRSNYTMNVFFYMDLHGFYNDLYGFYNDIYMDFEMFFYGFYIYINGYLLGNLI